MPDLKENSTSLRDFFLYRFVGKSSQRRAVILPGRLIKHVHRQTSKTTNEKLNRRAGCWVEVSGTITLFMTEISQKLFNGLAAECF